MKTTVEISNSLLGRARKLAARERISVRALIEEGLRRLIIERERMGQFKLRRATFKGNGLQPQLAGTSWHQIRELAYEGRGA